MKKHLSIFLLLFFSLTLQAYEGINFHVLDVRSGISDNYTQSLLHDKYGFMWFATRNGLNRYDGYHFKQYTTVQLGAYDNNVEWIAEDAQGIIWLKTPVNYCYYNREKDQMDNKIQIPLAKLNISSDVKQLFVDEDKNLWCVTADSILYYKFDQKKLFRLPIQPKIQIMDLACRNSQVYFLLSNGSIATVNWQSNQIEHETHIEWFSGFKHHIYMDTSLCLWLYATHGSSITCYSTKEQKWVNFPGQEKLCNGHNIITTVTDDGKGNVWIGTDNEGIYISRKYVNQFTQLHKESNKLFSLPSNHITCFFKDAEGIMWIGTSKQGVAYTSPDDIYFENYHCPGQEDVSCLLEDPEGNLWLGFDGEGIAKYEPKQKKYSYFKSSRSTIPSNLIVCSFLDSQKRIWWGSFGDGAFFYENGRFVSLKKLIRSKEQNFPLYIRRITEDINHNIWFATFTQGLYCLSPDGELTSYTMGNSILLTDYIADLSCADGRNLYIATGSGLYCMDVFSRKMEQLTENKSGQTIIQDNFANCIYQDSRGLLWIGGRKGVNIYNKNDDSLVHLTTENGISHPYIRAFVEDANKNMWITTDHGITHVYVVNDPNEKNMKFRCYPYFEEDGIGDFTFNNFSIIKNRQNEILIGGSGGYIKTKPRLSNRHHYDRQIVFTGLFLSNQRMDVGTTTSDGRVLLTKNIQLIKEITMNYSDTNFALEVSAMDYGNLHKLQYMYRLSEKEEWIKLEGNRIYFNKLSPGTHHLQVRVNEHQAGENSHTANLTIHVLPPIWLSVPAYISYFTILIFSMILLILQMRRKHKRVLQQQKHDMEVSQLHEMDEAKMRFFTNVSHDLRTPLSLIMIPLEKLLASRVTQTIKEDLELIYRNATTLLNEVNLLLDFRKLDQQKTQLSLSYGNLGEFIRETYTSFNALSSKSGIRLSLQVNAPEIEMNFDRNKIQRILLNLLSNAIKYNCEHGSVSITVDRIQLPDGEFAQIRVADTGIGIKDENKEKIFDRFFQEQHQTTTYVGSGIGLHIVKEYVTLHKGTIEVKDNTPRGSVFIVSLPIEGVAVPMDETFGTSPIKTEEKAEELPEMEKTGSKATLLIVEDNDDFRKFLIDCLKDHYQVFDAPDGKKALDVLALQPIQIVISDVMMPVMDGMELCREIKTDIRYSHIPIILLTARTAEEHVLSGLKEGADDYITKPFNLEILLLRIQKILKWTENNYEKFKTIDVSPSEITVSSLDEQLIEKSIRIVEQNIDNSEFSVEDLGTYVGMSRGHLYKKLMSITGKSPIEFIRILRIKRGRQLLEQGQSNIAQVAYQIGLSPKQFAKYFKEEFGCLPSEYDKAKKEQRPLNGQ